MGSKETGRIRRWIKEHSLDPHYYRHYCFECGRFKREWRDMDGLHRNYCLKKCRSVYPYKRACENFTFRLPKRKGKRHATFEEKNRELLAEKMMGNKRNVSEPKNPFKNKARCRWCEREVEHLSLNPRNVKHYCNKHCKRKFKRFCKKMEKMLYEIPET
jgi:hypothetical protein